MQLIGYGPCSTYQVEQAERDGEADGESAGYFDGQVDGYIDGFNQGQEDAMQKLSDDVSRHSSKYDNPSFEVPYVEIDCCNACNLAYMKGFATKYGPEYKIGYKDLFRTQYRAGHFSVRPPEDEPGSGSGEGCNCSCEGCNCSCDGSNLSEEEQNALLLRNIFSGDPGSPVNNGIEMHDIAERIVSTTWGKMILRLFSVRRTSLRIIWDPELETPSTSTIEETVENGRIVKTTIIITVKDTNDYTSVVSELYRSADGFITSNSLGCTEMGVRMFESILVANYMIEHTSANEWRIDNAMSTLLAEIADKCWDMNSVDPYLWEIVWRNLNGSQGDYGDYGDYGNSSSVEDLTKFNITLLRMVYNSYYKPVSPYDYGYGYGDYGNDNYGNDNYSGDYGSGYNDPYGYGYGYGYGDGQDGCNCDCQGCNCANN